MERISSGTILLLFLAVLFGLLGIFSVRRALRPRQQEARVARQTTVPMAGRDLEAGREVTLGDVALVRMTREQMKKRGIDNMFMADPQQIIGRTLKKDVNRQSTFDTEDFYPDGTGPGIARKLKAGERAMTVTIHDENAIMGFAGAGQLVDVLFRVGGGYDGVDRPDRTWHPSHRQWNGRMGYHGDYAANFAHHRGGYGNGYQGVAKAVTLMQGVRILALDDNVIQSDDRTRRQDKSVDAYGNEGQQRYRVTLAVKPEQAEVLRVVEGHGELSMTLRNPEDTGTLESIDGRTLDEILGIREIDRGPREMQVYRGQHVRHLYFDRSGPLSRRQSRTGRFSQTDADLESRDAGDQLSLEQDLTTPVRDSMEQASNLDTQLIQ